MYECKSLARGRAVASPAGAGEGAGKARLGAQRGGGHRDGRGGGGRGQFTLADIRALLEELRDTSLTLELNLSTFGTHPRVNLGHMEDRVSLS
jgi:hypothetical protein